MGQTRAWDEPCGSGGDCAKVTPPPIRQERDSTAHWREDRLRRSEVVSYKRLMGQTRAWDKPSGNGGGCGEVGPVVRRDHRGARKRHCTKAGAGEPPRKR